MKITVANNAVAIICDGIEIKGETIKSLVNGALLDEGFASWSSMETEVFTYGTKSLILARPKKPPASHPLHGTARLKRRFLLTFVLNGIL